MNIEIKELDRQHWEKYELEFSYTTEGYYSFDVSGWDFKLKFNPYGKTINKKFTDKLFEDWANNALAFGAFSEGEPVGFTECFMEKWNNRLRITNLLVFEKFRGNGIGTALIEKDIEIGIQSGARMAVLETQTCNPRAVEFYLKTGFKPIGFDLFSYSNSDAEKTEVRLEMGKLL